MASEAEAALPEVNSSGASGLHRASDIAASADGRRRRQLLQVAPPIEGNPAAHRHRVSVPSDHAATFGFDDDVTMTDRTATAQRLSEIKQLVEHCSRSTRAWL